MRSRDRLEFALAFLLLLDAAAVFVLQVLRLSAWHLICLYWLILTVKNAVALRGDRRGS